MTRNLLSSARNPLPGSAAQSGRMFRYKKNTSCKAQKSDAASAPEHIRSDSADSQAPASSETPVSADNMSKPGTSPEAAANAHSYSARSDRIARTEQKESSSPFSCSDPGCQISASGRESATPARIRSPHTDWPPVLPTPRFDPP